MMRKNLIIVVTGPSGAGKSTIVDYVVNKLSVTKLTTFTTRLPRKGEIEGKSYYYVSREKFKKVDKIEEAEYANNLYGVGKEEFNQAIAKYNEICVILEAKGVKYMKENYPNDTIVIYVDIDKNIMSERLSNRGDDIKDIETRVQNANSDEEYDSKKIADYIIYNNDLQKSLENIDTIIRGEIEKNTKRNINYLQELFAAEVKTLADEFCLISRLWEELQFRNSFEFDKGALNYPFEVSFDELMNSVITWRDNVLEFVKKDLSEMTTIGEENETAIDKDNLEVLHNKFKENVNKLGETCTQIDNLWERLQSLKNYDFDDEVEGYPFRISFDEVSSKVLLWGESISDFVKGKYNK